MEADKCHHIAMDVTDKQASPAADLAKAARDIIDGGAFDNNILCLGEKQVFAIDSIADALVVSEKGKENSSSFFAKSRGGN